MKIEGAIVEVFEFWRTQLSNARSRLDEKRRKVIASRLKDGYSVEDLKLAIMGCKSSDFHMGANELGIKYCSIDLICRSAEKVDQFIEMGERVANAELDRIAAQQSRESSEDEKRSRSEETQRKIDAVRAKLGRVRA